MNYSFLFVLFIIQKYNFLQIQSYKFCINCRFYIKNSNPEYGKCSYFSKKIDNNNYLVTGKDSDNIVEYYYCNTARNSKEMCGEEGKKYEKNMKKGF